MDISCLKFIGGYSLPDASVSLGEVRVYDLPAMDGGSFAGITIVVNSAPAFAAAVADGVNPALFTLSPTAAAHIGPDQVVSFYLFDGATRSADYSFLVTVLNLPPTFDGGAPSDIIAAYKVPMSVPIPSYSSPSGQTPITLTVTPQPSPVLTRNGDFFDIYCSDPSLVGTTQSFSLVLTDPFGASQTFTLKVFVRN